MPALPHQKTRGWYSLGKKPMPRKSSSTGSVEWSGRAQPESGSAFRDRTCPMNFSVTCRFSGFTQRATRGFWRERGDQFCEGAADFFRQIERDEEAHGLRPAASGEEKIAAHGIERGLRGVHADAFAVAAGELETALARAAFVGDANVHEADGFFRRAAARPRNSRDAHADCRARAFADAIGKSERHFRAYCAFRFD